MARKRARSPQASAGVLRLIGGCWRGRKLSFPDRDGLRPTGDRLRETLFNWLAPSLADAHCLDLFAGSGALGLEALSRGAASVTFIERDRQAARALRDSLATLGAGHASVECTDALRWLAGPRPERPFDVVFVDPPFAGNLWEAALDALADGWLADGAQVYIERPKNEPLTLPAGWQTYREKRAGDVCYGVYSAAAGN